MFPARRSIRLQSYDYADEGAYFVTLCTAHRECLFGEVVKGEMRLNDVGKIAHECWNAIPDHFPGVELDSYTIMPNHVHGIVVITEKHVGGVNVGAQHAAPLQSTDLVSSKSYAQSKRPNVTPGSLGAIVRSFKSAAARHMNLLHDTPSAPLWQRNYYEHVIRDEGDLNRIREYIECNPQRWETDEENPARWMQKS